LQAKHYETDRTERAARRADFFSGLVEEQNSQALLLLLVRSVVGSSAETPVSMGTRRCVGRVGRWRERRD